MATKCFRLRMLALAVALLLGWTAYPKVVDAQKWGNAQFARKDDQKKLKRQKLRRLGISKAQFRSMPPARKRAILQGKGSR